MVGRPRSTECDRAILEAALAEYAARGLEAMSVDAVAARAGVSKATIYRRYPSKVELVMAAVLMLCEETSPEFDTGTLEGDVRGYVSNLAQVISDPVYGAAKRTLLFDAVTNDDLLRMHRTLVATRRDQVRAMFERAIDRGEMRTDTDLEFATDQLGAPLFYRHLLLHDDIDDTYVAKVVTDFVARYGVSGTAMAAPGQRAARVTARSRT
ncbi:MAG TPA: TetR/AcrR family transcriptional regulator [Acidimicrobiia bacterium]|jgi:AcrR family transcriptional regulator